MSQQLTPEELQEFTDLRKEANRLASILGEVTYQQTLVEFELDNLKSAIKANVDKQQTQLRAFGEKYGDGSINAQTGEITPIETK